MGILVSLAAKASRLSGIACPDSVPPCLLDAVAISGPVQSIAPMQKPDGAGHALTLLLAERLALLRESQHLRQLRRGKAASTSEARLRAVTHDLLWLELGF